MLMRTPKPFALKWRLVSSAALLATMVCTPLAAAQPKPNANPPVVFAQAKSDIEPDAAARFGRLANGMTYVIYQNQTPPGEANVWMRIGAGSMMEADYQRGLAHFLEHMAFNGSKNVPQGEMVKMLERDGLKYGPDTNAFTSSNQTVYQLNLPRADQRSVQDALFLMHEVGAHLNLEPGAIDRQRGVILGEERARASANARAQESLFKAAFPGQKYASRLPIGLIDVIKTAKPQAIRDFYDDYYRPEYATLIVAGDIDPAAVEAKIKTLFSDWKGRAQSDHAATDYGAYQPQGERVHLYTEPGLPNQTALMWIKPFDEEVETSETDFNARLNDIALSILNARLEHISKTPDAKFLLASLGRSRIQHTAEVYSLTVQAKPHEERLAFDQSLAVLRQYLKYGAEQGELDRAIRKVRTSIELEAATAKTRSSRAIASRILRVVDSQAVLTSPEQDLQQWMSFTPRLTLAAVNHYIATLALGDGPLISRTGEDLEGFDRDAVVAAYALDMAAPVPPPSARGVPTWPYIAFGQPGAVATHTALKDVSADRVVFKNGVVLNFKHTDFQHGVASISVDFVGGFSQIPPDQGAVVAAANALGLLDGGLGKLEGQDIQDALLGHIYGADFGLGEKAVTLSGLTTRADLPTQMQVLMAFATDPGFRPEALERLKASLPNYFAATRATPKGVLSFYGPVLLHGGDQRYGFPTQTAFDAISNDQIKALVMGLLTTSPIEITMVGDLDEQDAIHQVAATFATLPQRPAVAPRPVVADVRFPKTDLRQILTHVGRADQNISYLAWPTTGVYADQRQARGLKILADLMTLRELDEIRERQGASYNVSTNSLQSSTYPGYGYLSTSAMVRPEIDQVFYDSVAKIVADLKAAPVTSDEMLRAKQPQLDAIQNERHTNGYWRRLLEGSAQDPRHIPVILEDEALTRGITPDYVQDLARKYLDMQKAVRIQVRAKAGL